ncbi:hypothetical protein WN55_09962 [Dufourea novaeangliae]|uniref:Uncharacterized protein n=1 Tax=Dufourea novaeangliae TaxID=178035 RepID=A0A154P9Q9_DUFNO|nr:hypothetical protein WN55_09962 [Dufourea novaeangliae]
MSSMGHVRPGHLHSRPSREGLKRFIITEMKTENFLSFLRFCSVKNETINVSGVPISNPASFIMLNAYFRGN